MKIIVPIKRVPDPEKADKVRISEDGKQLIFDGLDWKPNPFDEYAVETALRLVKDSGADQTANEVIVVSIGPEEATHQVLWCLAMGADRGILISGEDRELDATVVARAITKLVEKESPDLILMGKQTVDGDSNQTAQMLAGMLGWPQATFAGRIETPADLSSATVTREVDGGSATVTVKFPALISVDVRIVTPQAVNNSMTPPDELNRDGARFASLPGIMKAKKKPLDRLTLEDLGVDTSQRVKTISYSQPVARSGGIILETVEELVQKLKEEARVL